jgi:hypothetical protein
MAVLMSRLAVNTSAITTQATTNTGTLTPAEETALSAGFNRNTVTKEVWFKDSVGIVTKIEDKINNTAQCVISPSTVITSNGSYTYNHGLNDTAPLIEVIDIDGVVITSSINIETKIVDANNVKVSVGPVPATVKVKVCTGSFSNLTISGGGSGGAEVDPTALLKAGLASNKILGTNIGTATTGVPVVALTNLDSLDQALLGYPLTSPDQFGNVGPTEKVHNRLNRLESSVHQQAEFTFDTATITAGLHFDDGVGGEWIYTPKISVGTASTRYVTLQLQGITPATPTTVTMKVRRFGTNTLDTIAIFTVPANQTKTSASPFFTDSNTGFKQLNNGDKVVIDVSQAMPQVAMTIAMAYEHLA